ncbi:thioesterase [Nocardiopsis gilva YIM 90087]|uniref:Thioesterase n=1 Tax=Nocardiopsis gilva YIM 90087 TaxID=1235441 RepID=A0A223S169_9ACTN|nr:alpha/beta fold hydrolase [Nocardiopsis gilva]ASU81875.1 thioesterase [Nocardiopsis gilva YIM 90087]
MTSRPNHWTEVLRPAPRPDSRLIVFPHAGSGASRYLRIVSDLPEDVESVGVTLPGRDRRAGESPRTTMAAAVAAIRAELHAFPPRPTVFYGHSMGALLALATAHVSACDGVVASCSMPGTRGYPDPRRVSSPEGMAEIFALHKLPGDALQAPGLSRAQQTLAHDLSLTAEALGAVDHLRLGVPLTALAGTDDPLIPPDVLPLWATFTSGAFRERLVDGGHFFPFAPFGHGVLVDELSASLAVARSHFAVG